MKVGLFYSTTGSNNGPGKVVSNLAKGLELNGIEVLHNSVGDLNGCLQAWGTPIEKMDPLTLVGPNLCVVPSELPFIWKRFKNAVVPSDWVRDMYLQFPCVQNESCVLNVWAVGIDTEKFCPREENYVWDVLLYVKRREEEATKIYDELTSKGLRVVILVYGSYTENQLIDTARKSKCCVLLTRTESQGIAYQEILSMGLPCYVIDKVIWDDIKGYSYPATSVPYFDHRCGMKSQSMTDFSLFYEQLSSYAPRQYVLDNLSLDRQGREYLNLLRIAS